MIVRPGSVGIPADAARREPPRPIALRQPGYDERFDSETLYYDVFRRGSSAIAVGPPLPVPDSKMTGWTFATERGPVGAPRVVALDRAHRAVFRIPADASSMTISVGASSGSVEIGEDLAPAFAGTRALMTLQLDNDLAWIRDWVRWHVRAHGTDAVVVYDNGSTRYDPAELLDAIGIDGVRVAAVVEWAFPFGPLGGDGLPWDSDFAQYGAIEHARRRLLSRAAGMLSVDIDELVHASGDRTAYEIAASAPQGFALFAGTWAYADPGRPPAHPRHSDCRWVRTDEPDPAATKWCASPPRLPNRSQLVVHGAHGLTMPPLSPLAYWHMRPISTHWRMDRSATELTDDHLAPSPLLEEQIARYLVEPGTAIPDVPPVPGRLRRAASRLRLLGWRLRRLARQLVRGG